MHTHPRHAMNYVEFAWVRRFVERSVDTGARLPSRPFVAADGTSTVYEWDWFMSPDFGSILANLAQTFGDDEVYVLGVEPEPLYFLGSYGLYPAFACPQPRVAESFASGIARSQGSFGSFVGETNTVAISGSSGRWALWAQRDWEVAVVMTPESADTTWREATVPWFNDDADLRDFRGPEGWVLPLSDHEIDVFRREISGRDQSSATGAVAPIPPMMEAYFPAEQSIVSELAEVGIGIRSLRELIDAKHADPRATPVLLRHFESSDYPWPLLAALARGLELPASELLWVRFVEVLLGPRRRGSERYGICRALAENATPSHVSDLLAIAATGDLGHDRAPPMNALVVLGGARGTSRSREGKAGPNSSRICRGRALPAQLVARAAVESVR